MKFPWERFKATHRCPGSLEAKTPIRFLTKEHTPYEPPGWYIHYLRDDDEYDCVHLTRVAKIDFCPFCGQKLEGVEA